MTNRNLEDIRANTVNECYYCTKDSKDCQERMKKMIKEVKDE